MDFQQLHTLVNEIPHFEIPDNLKGEIQTTIDLNDVNYIDYKVETWEDVEFELRKSFVNILTDFNQKGVLLAVNNGFVQVVDEFGATRFNEHPELVATLQKSNISPTQFNNAIVANYSKFEYN